MSTFETHAICLRATAYRESDQILELYSAEHGKLSVVAKGVKKPTSKLRGACEPLTLNQVQLASGRNLQVLCHYDRVASFNTLRGDLERMAAGTVMTDIVRKVGRENDLDSIAVFTLLSEHLDMLDTPTTPWISASLSFQVAMLSLAGYLPVLTACIACDTPFDLNAVNHLPFFIDYGGFACAMCYPQLNEAKRVNVSTKTLQLLMEPSNAKWHTQVLKAHRFLAYYWGHRLERPLNSFDFLCQLLGEDHGPHFLTAPEAATPNYQAHLA